MDRASIPGLGLEELAPPVRVAGGPAAWLAVAVPLAFGLWSVSGHGSWVEDGAIVRDLGLLPAGTEGALSTLLVQLATLLPLGGRLLRAGVVGAFGLALASRLLFELVLGLLERRARSPLNPALALFASVIWALGANVLTAAARVGGPMPALVLVLLGLMLGRRAFERGDVRALAATGLVLGAACAERLAAGVSLVPLIIGVALSERRRGWQRELWRLLAGFAAGTLLFGSLRAVGLSGSAPSATDAPVVEPLAHGLGLLASLQHLPARWAEELGSAPLLLALVGAAVGAASGPLRRQLWPWACLAALGALVPVARDAGAAGVVDGGLFGVSSSLGVAVFFPLGVQALVGWLWASPLPYGRPAAVLTVTFATTLVLSRADGAGAVTTPDSRSQAWTDEALARLPPRSVLLLHDERLALRLMSARTLGGVRPDVAILPTPRLSVRSLRSDPDLADPSLLPLLRQLWVNGSADESSLSALADARPVFVEPEPDWDQRLLEHLAPEGLWLRFLPQSLGASERRAGSVASRAALRRALELAGADGSIDRDTRRVLAAAAARQAAVLGALGERELSGRMAHAARLIDRGDGDAGPALREPRTRVAARVVSR